MAKTKISEWSQTASNNTDLNGISCAEGMAPSDVNNWMRELMSQVKDFQVGADGDPLTVAGTFVAQGRADIGGALNVTGATALTGTLTAAAGIVANITGNVTGNVTGDVSGNAGTVTNGVYLDATQTLTAKTLSNPTVANYTEKLHTNTGDTTVDLANGTVQKITTNGANTITLPNSATGKSYVIIVAYGGTHTVTWAGGSTIKWNNGSAPTQTSTNGKFDIFTFFCDGTNTYGSLFGRNF
jgi:hypothetical protein